MLPQLKVPLLPPSPKSRPGYRGRRDLSNPLAGEKKNARRLTQNMHRKQLNSPQFSVTVSKLTGINMLNLPCCISHPDTFYQNVNKKILPAETKINWDKVQRTNRKRAMRYDSWPRHADNLKNLHTCHFITLLDGQFCSIPHFMPVYVSPPPVELVISPSPFSALCYQNHNLYEYSQLWACYKCAHTLTLSQVSRPFGTPRRRILP